MIFSSAQNAETGGEIAESDDFSAASFEEGEFLGKELKEGEFEAVPGRLCEGDE